MYYPEHDNQNLVLKSCRNMIRNFEWSLARALKQIKDLLVIPKSGRGRLWEQSLITAFDYRVY